MDPSQAIGSKAVLMDWQQIIDVYNMYNRALVLSVCVWGGGGGEEMQKNANIKLVLFG